MRRRARRLHLKCRPKVERTTFRHSLIRRDRRARSSRIGAKNAERDGSATTYESTGIVCSGASNSFGGAMMIFFDGASRCVCVVMCRRRLKRMKIFYLFSQIKGWYLSEKVPHKVLSSSEPQKVLFKETPTSLRNHRPRRLSTFFAFKKEKKKREEEEKKR